jgi:hypothetical protein
MAANLGNVQSVFRTTRGVLGEVAAPCTAEAGCPGTIASRGALVAPKAPASTGAPDGSVAVYAASLERVFRIRGGATPEVSSHAASASGAWTTRTPAAGSLGRIVDATYHVFDGMLWVLDEVGTGFFRSYRLLRVSPFDGSVDEVARFPRLGLFDTHWLVSDHDGRILLAASSSLLRRHVLVKLRIAGVEEEGGSGELRVEGVYGERGELLAPPRVSEQDLALIVQRTRQDLPTVTRFLRFPGKKGSQHDLNDCF